MEWHNLPENAKKIFAKFAPTPQKNPTSLENPAPAKLNRSLRDAVRGYVSVGLLAVAVTGVVSQGALGDDEQPASAAKASPASAENAAVVREHTQFGVAQPADQARSETDAKAAAPAAKAAGQGGAAQSKSDGGKKVAEVAQPKPAAQPKAAPAPQAAPKPAPAPAPKPAPAPAGDRVDRWIHQAIVIMQSKGVPVSHADKDEIRTVIEKESSGDPKAINLWDSNAEKGTPSKGLMQTIDPTFDAHKLPGHDDIYNPVDNIIAGVRYTLDRYGSFDEHPGLASMSDGGDYQGY